MTPLIPPGDSERVPGKDVRHSPVVGGPPVVGVPTDPGAFPLRHHYMPAHRSGNDLPRGHAGRRRPARAKLGEPFAFPRREAISTGVAWPPAARFRALSPSEHAFVC